LARIFGLVLLAAASAAAQASYTVESGKSIALESPGATAAYAVNGFVAEVRASGGAITITGLGAGKTTIVIVAPSGLNTVVVTVTAPPLPLSLRQQQAIRGEGFNTGSYGFEYNSDPQQVANSLDYIHEYGRSFQRLQLADTAYPNAASASWMTLPLASFEVHSPERDLTLLDKQVENSELTLNGVTLRGLHYQQGDWNFQAGYANLTGYQNILLSTDPEYAFGLTWRHPLDEAQTMAWNVYYFDNPLSRQNGASNGPVVSYVHSYQPHPGVHLQAELGFGRSVAAALAARMEDSQRQLHADFRVLPRAFSSLALNVQHGDFGTVDFLQKLRERYTSQLSADVLDYALSTSHERTANFRENLSSKLNRHFTASVGSNYARFSTGTPVAVSYQSLSVPVGLDFYSRHFIAGVQDMPTTDFGDRWTNGYGLNAATPWGPLQFSASYRRDVDMPTVVSVLAEAPGLQDALTRAGIAANSLDDILQLLNNSAELTALGLSNLIGLSITPVRDSVSAGVSWSGKGPREHRVSLAYWEANSKGMGANPRFQSETLLYSCKVAQRDELNGSLTVYQGGLPGQAGLKPVVQVGLRHSFYSSPLPFALRRHGTISGHVFLDPASASHYGREMQGLEGVEVRLDGERTTRSDAQGYYAFDHVPAGRHQVAAKYSDERPFFYTTSSPATTNINRSVDFGVNYLKGTLWGSVVNDAGSGVPGVVVVLHGPGKDAHTQTNPSGGFSFADLPDGIYSLTTVAESYPAGYGIQDLAEQTTEVKAGTPARAQFSVRAARSVAGLVSYYDARTARTVPLEGMPVRIPELGLETRTDKNGRYGFRRLPAGKFSVTVESHVQEVELPPAPTNLRNIDFSLASDPAKITPPSPPSKP
jgi:hypothetical protein